MSTTLLQALVDRAIAGPGAFQVTLNGSRVTLGPAIEGGFVLEIGRPAGRVGEREAVDIAVQVHKMLERKGIALGSEMLAYQGGDRTRCFVLSAREAVSA